MDSTGITPVMNVGGYGDGWNGNNSFFWIFALIALMNGGFGFGGRNQAATTDELSAGFNFSGVNNKLNEITASIAGVNQNLGNAICSSTYELASKIDKCCCDTQAGIQQVRYDMAVQNGDLKSIIHTEAEATRALIQQNKIEGLQAQVNQLQMAQALCGVPKINSYAWGVTPINACGYGYGCGCTNI